MQNHNALDLSTIRINEVPARSFRGEFSGMSEPGVRAPSTYISPQDIGKILEAKKIFCGNAAKWNEALNVLIETCVCSPNPGNPSPTLTAITKLLKEVQASPCREDVVEHLDLVAANALNQKHAIELQFIEPGAHDYTKAAGTVAVLTQAGYPCSETKADEASARDWAFREINTYWGRPGVAYQAPDVFDIRKSGALRFNEGDAFDAYVSSKMMGQLLDAKKIDAENGHDLFLVIKALASRCAGDGDAGPEASACLIKLLEESKRSPFRNEVFEEVDEWIVTTQKRIAMARCGLLPPDEAAALIRSHGKDLQPLSHALAHINHPVPQVEYDLPELEQMAVENEALGEELENLLNSSVIPAHLKKISEMAPLMQKPSQPNSPTAGQEIDKPSQDQRPPELE